MGPLPKTQIKQPDWFVANKIAHYLGMSVEEFLALPDDRFNYWWDRGLSGLNTEAEADRLVRKAEQRKNAG